MFAIVASVAKQASHLAPYSKEKLISTRKKTFRKRHSNKTLLRPLEKALPCTTLKNPYFLVGWLVGRSVGPPVGRLDGCVVAWLLS